MAESSDEVAECAGCGGEVPFIDAIAENNQQWCSYICIARDVSTKAIERAAEKPTRLRKGWRSTAIAYIEVVADAETIGAFRDWMRAEKITFYHSCSPYNPLAHSGYFREAEAKRIEAWLGAHVEQTWPQAGRV